MYSVKRWSIRTEGRVTQPMRLESELGPSANQTIHCRPAKFVHLMEFLSNGIMYADDDVSTTCTASRSFLRWRNDATIVRLDD